MADVFISYSRSDRPTCTEMRDALTNPDEQAWQEERADYVLY